MILLPKRRREGQAAAVTRADGDGAEGEGEGEPPAGETPDDRPLTMLASVVVKAVSSAEPGTTYMRSVRPFFLTFGCRLTLFLLLERARDRHRYSYSIGGVKRIEENEKEEKSFRKEEDFWGNTF